VCGWFAVSGWIALVATAGSLAGSLITGAISLVHENYTVERWHIFLIYLAYMLGACFINIFGLRILPTIDRAAIFWYVPLMLIRQMLTSRSMTGAVIIIITCLSCASPNFQSADFVFTRYINDVGWNNGVAWILGLLQSEFFLTLHPLANADVRFIRIDRLRCRIAHGRGNAQPTLERSKDDGRCCPHWC